MRRKCQLRVNVDPKTRDSWQRSNAMSIQYNVSVHDLLELLKCSVLACSKSSSYRVPQYTPSVSLPQSHSQLHCNGHTAVCHQHMSGHGHHDGEQCPCGETQTISHIVECCPLTKLNGGLSRLHSVDEDAVSWLTSYGSWHAYEKKKSITKVYKNETSKSSLMFHWLDTMTRLMRASWTHLGATMQ